MYSFAITLFFIYCGLEISLCEDILDIHKSLLYLLLFYTMNVPECSSFLSRNFDRFTFLIQDSIAVSIFVHIWVYLHETVARSGVAEFKDIYILNLGVFYQISLQKATNVDFYHSISKLPQSSHLLTYFMSLTYYFSF